MSDVKVAYFSAEIGIDPKIKTYSGGLGILAGDTIKAMADLNFPFCAITLLYKQGYFKQKIEDNSQSESQDSWDFMKILKDCKKEVKVRIHGQDIFIKIWETDYKGVEGHSVPIYFLDTDLDKNPKWAQEITKRLYVGDRLQQEIVLGIGGLKALKELGHNNIQKYHMNEGHSSFLTLQLYKQIGETQGWDDGLVRDKCVFTTHTPIPAGHDRFSYDEIYDTFHEKTKLVPWHIKTLAGEDDFNTTKLAMSFSGYINAVSKKHQEVTQEMFPGHTINYITNGIHAPTWASKYMQELFDKEIPNWRSDSTQLKNVINIDNKKILEAHHNAKEDLINFVNNSKRNVIGTKLDDEVLTIGFARRFVEYKDAELIFKNINQLKELGEKVQFIFAGKSHIKDGIGKSIMKRVIEHAKELKDTVKIAFIEDYDIEVAKLMVSGCNLWLNTPIPNNEASGTSGMKASVNGCIHFSKLDGWAIESFEMDGGGFPIYRYEDFMMTLKYMIIPKYYQEYSTSWAHEMKLSIGNAASYFNTHRMAKEYIEKAYKMNIE